MKLSVISPTLNEAENVPRLVEQLGRALGDIDYEILIVDDDSADLTWSVALEISSTNPRVRALRRMRNPGLGLAVIDGFSAADGDVLACIDADLQHDPSILPRMLDELQTGIDVVVGSRHIEGGSTGKWTRWRRMKSWIATKTAQFLLGVTLKDPMSGYFLVRREDFSRVKDQLNGGGFKILLELLAYLHTSEVREVPYTFQPRTCGKSKLSNKVIFLYIQQLWRLCSASRHRSVRLLKSAIVGGIGTFVNLGVMALLLWLTNIRDWRASAIASLAANVQNYLLNYFWTYPNRSQSGFQKLKDYLSYLMVSATGLVVTTVSYAALIWNLTHTSLLHIGPGAIPPFTRLSCQFVAVFVGVCFNYASNKLFAWPYLVRVNLDASETASTPSLIELTERRRHKNVLDLDAEV
jgi:dolichol-phosphate mannosyltransferase